MGKGFFYTHKIISIELLAGKKYKLLVKWYKDPVSINAIFYNYPNVCWRCHYYLGSCLHIWWSCAWIQTLWWPIETYNERRWKWNENVMLSPEVAHLSILPGPKSSLSWAIFWWGPGSWSLRTGGLILYHSYTNGWVWYMTFSVWLT